MGEDAEPSGGTCLEEYGGSLLEFPAEPTLGLVITSVCILVRLWVASSLARRPDPKTTTKPFYGLVAGKFLYELFGIILFSQAPMTIVFFCFRLINGGKGYRQEDFACYLQSGKNFGPGSYLTIISLAYVLILLTRMNQRLTTRFEMAKIWSDLGFLKPVTLKRRNKETKERQRRIGFIQTGAGAWILPFVQNFEKNAGGDEGNKCDVVCFDNYGHPKLCDFMDDQWLRLNLLLDGTLESGGALKVFKTDFVTLDIPSHSLDVVLMPTGANLNIFRADKTIKTEEEREARLVQILSEIHRVLRPRGVLLSSTLFFSCPLWERAVARAGFSIPVQPEAALPFWASLLPKKLRSALLPDPSDEDGHGTGRKGWLPKLVYWAVLPARMHVAVSTGGPPLPRSASEDGAAGGSDVIPDAVAAAAAASPPLDEEGEGEEEAEEEEEEQELPTNEPIVYTSNLADREELDFFPPGLQFRVAEALILVNVISWLGLVFFIWLDLREMQVPTFLPFTRQVCSFFIDIVAFLPMVMYYNAEELREKAKTRGMLVPVTVLRNVVVRKWLSQRFTFILSALFILITWAPYLALDSFLVKVLDKSASEAREVDWAVSLVIALFFIVGGPSIGSWLARHFKAQQEKEDREEQEDLARESIVSISTTASSRQQGCKEGEVPLSDVESPFFKRVAQAAEKAMEKTKELPRL